jgi:hypothetical protein
MTTLTDDDLEARLRATYRTVTATTVAVPRALPRPEPRPTRPLRYAVAALAAVLLAGLVVVPRMRDTASGAGSSGRHAVVQPPAGFRFDRVRPYDPRVGGLGPATGDWLQYFRGADRLDVYTLRGPMPSLDGFAETDTVLGRLAFLSEDGTTLMWQYGTDITVAVRLTTAGPTPSSLPVAAPAELRAAAVNVSMVSDAAWQALQRRQGFATLRPNHPDEPATIDGPQGVSLRREISGSLRGGVVECVHPVVGRVDPATSFCGRDEQADPILAAIPLDDDRFLLLVVGEGVATVTFDDVEVDMEPLVITDTATRYLVAVVDGLFSARHVAEAFGADGQVVFTAYQSPQS